MFVFRVHPLFPLDQDIDIWAWMRAIHQGIYIPPAFVSVTPA